jgi:hypothetical protein
MDKFKRIPSDFLIIAADGKSFTIDTVNTEKEYYDASGVTWVCYTKGIPSELINIYMELEGFTPAKIHRIETYRDDSGKDHTVTQNLSNPQLFITKYTDNSGNWSDFKLIFTNSQEGKYYD